MRIYSCIKFDIFIRENKTNMKTIILAAIFALLFMVSSLDARELNHHGNRDMELTDKNARMFLRAMMKGDDSDDDDAASMDTRQAPGCVKCKFNTFDCCSPNWCKVKHLLPDECVEVKPGK
jgi:hypothetical protein